MTSHLIKVNASGLVGTGAIARVDEEVKGSCLSGYFRVYNGSRETDPIHWNASAAIVQSELIRSGVVDNRMRTWRTRATRPKIDSEER